MIERKKLSLTRHISFVRSIPNSSPRAPLGTSQLALFFEGNLSMKLAVLLHSTFELSLRPLLSPSPRSQSREDVYESRQSPDDGRFRPVFYGIDFGVCIEIEY